MKWIGCVISLHWFAGRNQIEFHECSATEVIARMRAARRKFDLFVPIYLTSIPVYHSWQSFRLLRVFIDADKRQYTKYMEELLDLSTPVDQRDCLLNPGALVLVDNTLWKGLVLNQVNDLEQFSPDPLLFGKNPKRMQDLADTMHQFNSFIKNQPNLRQLILPLRDGLSIIQYMN